MDARHNGIGRATSLNNAALAAFFFSGGKDYGKRAYTENRLFNVFVLTYGGSLFSLFHA